MTKEFKDFIENFILKWETEFQKGHYGDYDYAIVEKDPDDEGNWVNGKLVGTRFGIDARGHPDVDIAKLTKDDAIAIYWKDYYLKCKCDNLESPLRWAYLNCCINCGKGRADKIIAKAKTAKAFLDEQEAFYGRLVAAKPSFSKFKKGWLRRTVALKQYLKV